MQEAEQGKEGVAAEEKVFTDRFTKMKKSTILGSACCVLDLSQGTHRSAIKLLRSLQDEIRSANTTQSAIDACLE